MGPYNEATVGEKLCLVSHTFMQFNSGEESWVLDNTQTHTTPCTQSQPSVKCPGTDPLGVLVWAFARGGHTDSPCWQPPPQWLQLLANRTLTTCVPELTPRSCRPKQTTE